MTEIKIYHEIISDLESDKTRTEIYDKYILKLGSLLNEDGTPKKESFN